jgi:KDO2-lipid IV(A) lauroyltransferase
MFVVFRGLLGTITLLPLPALYLISDLLRLIVQYIVRYRHKTITRNLLRSFPDKSHDEIRRIRKEYYRNLCDVTVETLKLMHIRRESLQSRCTYSGMELIRHSTENGKSVIILNGHTGNWEWTGVSMGMASPAKFYALARPLKNQQHDQFLNHLRSKFNSIEIIPNGGTYRRMKRNSQAGPSVTFMLSDQTPTPDHIDHWQIFLNQDTPFFMGAERLARALDLDVFYIDIRRTRRGYYHGHLVKITCDASNTPEHQITSSYVNLLEKTICASPENWLWSHRRWKIKRAAHN